MTVARYLPFISRFTLFASLLLLFSSCSVVPLQQGSSAVVADAALKQKLEQHYREWRGVRYQLGGTTKRGVDCSAFVQEVFRARLGVVLPRTTALQSRSGVAVRRDALQRGDLVFFKTGRRTRHVGIYLEAGRFLHASTSRGVTISSLDNPYWRDRYWRARRVLSAIQQ